MRFSPPQGYPAGSAPATVQASTSTATSAASTGTFYHPGGTQARGYYPLTVPVPDGATAIVSVMWTGTNTDTDHGWAVPQGADDPSLFYVVATLVETNYNTGTFDTFNVFNATLSGDLALSTSGITVPADFASTTYNCAVVYYGT